MDDLDTALPLSGHLSPGLLDFLIVLGVILLVVMIVVFWAISIRKRKNRVRKYHHHHRRKGIREQLQKNAGDLKELIRQRQHGRQHEQRPLNPTLAQTGGLPPRRESEKPHPPPRPQ